jgi:hypothetical protein
VTQVQIHHRSGAGMSVLIASRTISATAQPAVITAVTI